MTEISFGDSLGDRGGVAMSGGGEGGGVLMGVATRAEGAGIGSSVG